MTVSSPIAWLLLLTLLCSAADEAKPALKQKMAADFKSCPNGHAALKDIQIVWGLVGPLHKKPADYNEEDRKIAERVAKGEVVLGGDLIPPNRPTTRIVCQKCGFEYNPWDLTDDTPFGDVWMGSGIRPEDFNLPFSKTLLGFPVLQPVKESVGYSQTLDASGKLIRSDGGLISHHIQN